MEEEFQFYFMCHEKLLKVFQQESACYNVHVKINSDELCFYKKIIFYA